MHKSAKTKKPTAKKAAVKKPVSKPETSPEPPVDEPEAEPTPEPEVEPAPEPEVAPEEEPEPPKPKSLVSGPDGGFGVPSDEPLLKDGEPCCKLKNMRNRRVDITLEHEVYCTALGRCVCSSRVVIRERRVERKSKAMAPRKETIRLPKSLILAPMGVSEPLHAAVKECVDVKSKLNNRPQKLMIVPI